MHVACRDGNTELVQYFLQLLKPSNKWRILCNDFTDLSGDSLIHCARTKEIAKIILDFASADSTREKFHMFLCHAKGISEETVLHTASRKGRLDVLHYILSNYAIAHTKLVYIEDTHKNSPLHMAKKSDIVQCLLSFIPAEKIDNFIWKPNNDQQTVVHNAAQTGRTDVV